jgi:hypothetical protein
MSNPLPPELAHAEPLVREFIRRNVALSIGGDHLEEIARDAAVILASSSDFAVKRAMADILNRDARHGHPDLAVPR